MRDALAVAPPSRCRALLAMIFACCSLASLEELGAAFKNDLAEDFRHRGLSSCHAEAAAPTDLQEHLSRHSLTCNDLDLPLPDHFDLEEHRSRDLRAELAYDTSFAASCATRMRRSQMSASPEQATAFDEIRAALDSHEAAVFFLDGPGGIGTTLRDCAPLCPKFRRDCGGLFVQRICCVIAA